MSSTSGESPRAFPRPLDRSQVVARCDSGAADGFGGYASPNVACNAVTGSAEMRETTFIIMTALAGHRMHGYGIGRAAAELSNGRVRLGPGTLYGALDRLVEAGLVEPAGEETENGRFRRYYKLTRQGAETLGKEADRMAANVRNARRRLSSTTAGGAA